MIPGSVARSRVPAVVRQVMLLVPILLAMGVMPGVARAADPRSIDAHPAPVGGRPGDPSGRVASEAGTGAGTGSPQVVFHGPRTDRVVALTFDDGYAPANVRQIFEELKQAGVAATFFVNGAYLRLDPQVWRSIAAAGYPIGNHTVLHEDVRGRPPGQVEADLTRNARLVQQFTGRPMIPVFRPPYGYHDPASDAAAAAAGFPTIVLWDVTGGDSARGAADAAVLANASAGRPGSIVLLHAGPSVTPRILPALIARYRARGFTFVTVPELLGIAGTWAAVAPGTGPATPPDDGGAAPTPPAVPPTGDDRGGVPVSPGDAATPSSRPAATPSTGGSADGVGAAPAPVASPTTWDVASLPAKAAASSGRAPASPLARDAAWARSPARDGLVAGATVAVLGVLVLLAAVAGRRERRTG